MNNLIKKIMELEGKKHQASIGDVREIVKVLTSIIAVSFESEQKLFIEFNGYFTKMRDKIKKKYPDGIYSSDEALQYLLKGKAKGKKK